VLCAVLALVNLIGVAAGLDPVPDRDDRLLVPRGRSLRAAALDSGGIRLMARVLFDNVTKRFDGTDAVKDFTVEVPDGEFLVLVGPSGCGKSTALRMLAGLEEVTDGRILIGERVVNNVAAGARDVAMVFQSYALYPHMSVYDNMAFPLQMQHMKKPDIDKRVKSASGILGLDNFLQAEAASAFRRPAPARGPRPRDRRRR